MSFGPDIEELLDDIGTPFTIIRNSGNITGEKLLYVVNRQVTKPFIREFFIEATVSYNTDMVGGDVISFSDNRVFLVANCTPRHFEGSAFDKQAVLYKCNVSGELQRFSGEGWDSDYQTRQVFTVVDSQVYGLITEELYGNKVEEDAPVGQMQETSLFFYVPANSGIRPLDRYIPYSGEQAYIVEDIDKHMYDGVWVAHLERDMR
jgi:hypothetical protein